MSAVGASYSLDSLKAIIQRHWGFPALRPLQEQAMRAVLEDRDSLVVLPTGGGKSLCYQAPAVLRGDTTVVISPLISLMKDQVDSLRQCGVAAAQIDSSLTATEKFAYEMDVRQGAVRLLFVSPERLTLAGFQYYFQRQPVIALGLDGKFLQFPPVSPNLTSMTRPLALFVYERLLPAGQLVNRLQDLGYRVQSLEDPATLVFSLDWFLPSFMDAEIQKIWIIDGGLAVTLGRGGADLPPPAEESNGN